MNKYGSSVFRNKLGPYDRIISEDQRLAFNNAIVEPVKYCTVYTLQLQEDADQGRARISGVVVKL